MQQQPPYSTGLPTNQQAQMSPTCLPDARGRTQGTMPDQQPGAGLLSGMQHNHQWEGQQQAKKGAEAGHWAGDTRSAGAKTQHRSVWERNVAAVWGKAQTGSSKPMSASLTAGRSRRGVLDVSGPEHADTSHWVNRHRQFALHSGNGGVADATAAVSSHWATGANKAAGGGSRQQEVLQQVQQHKELAEELASRMAIDAGPARCQSDNKATSHVHYKARQQDGTDLEGDKQQAATLWAASAANDKHSAEPVAPYIASKPDNSYRPAASSPATEVQDVAEAVNKASQPSTGSVSPAVASIDSGAHPTQSAGNKRELALEAEDSVMAEAEGNGAAQGFADVAGDLNSEMPHLKKLRTHVEDARDSSVYGKQSPGSPSPVDYVGDNKPTNTYTSPKIEQTLRSYPDLDCNSAKALGVNTRTKPLGLSRFASAGEFPGSPAAAVADCGVAGAYAQKSTQQEGGCHSEVEGMASQTAAVAGRIVACTGTGADGQDVQADDPWVKHHKEVQQLKQQQEALRALLQQAEQQVRTPLLQEAAFLSKEMQEKGGAQAEETLGGSQTDSALAKRTAESHAERVAAQMLAQEGGNWEKAMQRIISMVQGTMQHSGTAKPSSSTRRMSGLHRCSSAASPVTSGAADAAAAAPACGEAGLMQRQHSNKRDLSRQGSSHWGLQRQESGQGNMSPYEVGVQQGKAAVFTSPHSTAVSAGPSNSPFQTSAPTLATATGGPPAGLSNSPYPAGPVSAVKLAWPMVPTSAVGSPAGSPACSPMVPASAVGSPVTTPADPADAVGGISSMILPTTAWQSAAAACSPAAPAGGSGYRSPVAMAVDGCSPCGSPVLAGAAAVTAAQGRHGSPVCTAGRLKQGMRQPSRMAPKPPRVSVASMTAGLMCAPGLSISAGGPSAHAPIDAAAMTFSNNEAMQAAVAAFAAQSPQVEHRYPADENMCDEPQGATADKGRVEAVTNASAADVNQAGAADSSQQPQAAQVSHSATTAAAAAAAFGKVPALSVDQELEDAAGWLFGENGLLPDTPGPANLLTSQTAIGNNAQQQQAATDGLSQQPSGQQQQPSQQGLAVAPMVAQGGDGSVARGNSTWAAGGAAAAEVPWNQAEASAPAQGLAAPIPGQSWGQAWQSSSQPAAGSDLAAVAASQEQYQLQQSQHSLQHSQEVGSQIQQNTASDNLPAGAAQCNETKALGSDKDDIAMLQVLLGWAD